MNYFNSVYMYQITPEPEENIPVPNPNHVVQLVDFHRCCGIKILHTFDTLSTEYYTFEKWKYNYGGSRGTKKQYDDWVSTNCETRKEYQKRLRNQLQEFITDWTGGKSFFLAVTNKYESEAGADEVFEALGWEKLVDTMRNPTGSTITLWIYYLIPKEKKEQKSALKRSYA